MFVGSNNSFGSSKRSPYYITNNRSGRARFGGLDSSGRSLHDVI